MPLLLSIYYRGMDQITPFSSIPDKNLMEVIQVPDQMKL